MTAYDILLKNATVVDPASGRVEAADLAVAGGQIADIGPDLDPTQAREVFDLRGCHLLPGIVDMHMHASAWLGGRAGHKMMAEVGVTTALDMSGPIDSVLDIARDHGVGLNIACIEAVRPGQSVQTADPGPAELRALLDGSLRKGAIGVKLLGGHYPLTPEATARTIELANEARAYVALHAGSATQGSNIEGLLQAVELAGPHALHIAHVNSYCRGAVRACMQETEEAIAALTAHPNLRSESYLSPLNGTSATCSAGAPESRVTQHCLTVGGFPPTEVGFEAAILAGWAQINVEAGGRVVLGTGPAARDYWRQRNTDATVSFAVNPPEPRLRLATAKRPSGEFAVDAISTDGGGIPRNVIVEMGLALVKLQALTLVEFARKTSLNPARILGLGTKGTLRPGADADITAVSLGDQRAILGIANGRVVMHQGYVCGSGSRIVTTAAGAAAVRARGLAPVVVDLAESRFYRQ
ncbi:MAG: pyrC 2 [candidate division NC10 bacterium]|nr:pyrC 2 [candidate division NC10 bacterium]